MSDKRSEITVKGQNIEISGNANINWMYPEIYNKGSKNILKIALFHTRAAGDIEIEYDSDQDGWCIFRSDELNQAREQVAFIPAWKEE